MARRRRTRKKKSGGLAGFVLGMLFVLVLVTGGGAAWLVLTPFGPETENFVDLPTGSTAGSIGRQLEDARIIRSRYGFELVRLWKRGRLRAGEYRFDHPATVLEVYQRIARGDVYTRSVTIPEGENLFGIAGRLEQAGFGTRTGFLEVAANEVGLVRDMDPGAKSLEGYLFPDTYRFARKATAEQICAAMVKRFRTEAAQLGLKENLHRVVTLASLGEKETALEAERPLVASVFENRLKRKMPLMTDPSIIYGLELKDRWRGAIYKSDLKLDTPYNTYLHAGLPPGPVANPGLKSLQAAMEPAATNYLYFVASGANPQGGSLFAATLDEHNRNVAGYRKATRKAGGR